MGESNTIVSAYIGTYNSIALTHRYYVDYLCFEDEIEAIEDENINNQHNIDG